MPDNQPEAARRERKTLRATGFAMLDNKGKILLSSIRKRRDEVLLAAGDGKVYPVTVFLEMECDDD